jgi:hypothetical protein
MKAPKRSSFKTVPSGKQVKIAVGAEKFDELCVGVCRLAIDYTRKLQASRILLDRTQKKEV